MTDMITLSRAEVQRVLAALEYAGPSWLEARQPIADALRERLAQPVVNDSLTTANIIDDIADNLLQDHVELMAENKQLRESLQEILHENYAPEHYTDETIEYEMGQGNMMMPAVKRAYALVGRGRS